MKFSVDFWSEQKYLPTKRHRVLRTRHVKNSVDVDVKELTLEEFPVAFVVHDYQSVYENAKSYNDFDGNSEYRMFSEEIRAYNGNFYRPVRVTYGVAISLIFEPLSYIQKSLRQYEPYSEPVEDFTDASIVKEDSIEDCKLEVFLKASKYVIYEGKVWQICGEPMYLINTFGLGHNHGGTGFFIKYHYNPNISKENYFNALERDASISYGKQIALNRGDTDSVDGIGDDAIIEVLMPELVKRNPQKEHGDGNPFLNSLKDVSKNTSNIAETGVITLALSLSVALKE